jgi:3-aminobutyryl-CoA ammonia-lyase
MRRKFFIALIVCVFLLISALKNSARFFVSKTIKYIRITSQISIMKEEEYTMKSLIRLRMSAHDAHYGGNLVDGARMLQLFGDVATELLILNDGDEGLFKAYDAVEFLAPVYAGDYIEAVGEIVNVGNSSRKMTFEARKVIVPRPDINDSACDVLAEPIVVCRASGTCVVPKGKQRK